MNVIIFEREEDILDLLSYNLEKNGFQVKSCYEKDVFCSCLDSFDPQLVIIGNVGIDEDVIEFVKSIRATFKKSLPSVVCLTTNVDNIPNMMDSGLFDKVLSTPITPKSLIKEINHLLNISLMDAA